MAKRGTPAKIDLAELEKLCGLQCTDEELGAWFGVTTRTIERRRKNRAFGEWNTFQITAQGDHFVIVYNGVKVVDAYDSRLTNGAIGLQLAHPEDARAPTSSSVISR